jgi:predicted secreted protein
MKRFSAVAIVLMVAALTLTAVAGCGSSTSTSANGKTFTVDTTNITAKVGDQFTIQLTSNQTTGFQWGLSGSLNPAVVKMVRNTYVAGAASSPNSSAVGVGGLEKWVFKCVGKGTATIVLIYSQPFDKTAKPAQTETFTLTVQ